jgi:hypothetical protein
LEKHYCWRAGDATFLKKKALEFILKQSTQDKPVLFPPPPTQKGNQKGGKKNPGIAGGTKVTSKTESLEAPESSKQTTIKPYFSPQLF